MAATDRSGRIIGALIIAQMIGGVLVNFTLTAPLFGTPGFLVAAAPHAQQIALSVILGLALGGMWVAMSITAYPVFRRQSEALALWFFAMTVVNLAVAVVEQTSVMSMVSLSQAYANAAAGNRDQFEALRGVVASARNWVHFTARGFDGLTLLALYTVLFRFALVPRALAAFGLLAVLLQLTSLGMPFFGHEVVFPMLAPLGLCQLVLAIWLIAKGFREPAAVESRVA